MNDDSLYQLIGARIRAARTSSHRRPSQAQLAAELRISRASMVNIEAGKQRLPIHVLWRIAEILDIEPDKLLPRRDELQARDELLDHEEAAKIEANASGNEETARRLTSFVNRARKAK